MRILHTADIHLRSAGDDVRWHALESIVQLAEAEHASLVVISGDMFDRGIDAHKLKNPIRNLLRGRGFQVVVLPGNHDLGALAEGDYYGENVTILGEAASYCDVGDVRLLGFPFEKIVGERVIERLFAIQRRLRPGARNILLYHGELLDLFYSRDAFGGEEESGYMPVRLSSFDGLGFDYVLAGHFHSSFEEKQFDGGYFVYPGSPVSITKKETGVRKVNLFDVGRPPNAVGLGTHHYEEVMVSLNPFVEKNPFDDIHDRIRSCHPNARILLNVSGFVNLGVLGKSEGEFAAAVDQLKTPQVESILDNWQDVGTVMENELFVRFTEKLDAEQLEEGRKSAIRELVIDSMMEAAGAD